MNTLVPGNDSDHSFPNSLDSMEGVPDGQDSISEASQVVVASIRDSAGNVVDLSKLPRMNFGDRVRLITAYFPEYLQEIDKKVNGLLSSFNVEDEKFSGECKLAVRERVENIIGGNTYSNTPICSLNQGGDRLAHLLEKYGGYSSNQMLSENYELVSNIQNALNLIAIEIAGLCFKEAGYTDKGIYLVGQANAPKSGILV